MELHLRNRDPKDLLFGSESTPAVRQDGVADSKVVFEHEVGQGSSQHIVFDGLSIYRGWHRVDRDVVLYSEQPSASVELHFALKGGVDAHVQGLQEAVCVRPGTHLIWYAPEPRLHFTLAPDVRYEIFEVNLTTDYFASLAERYPELLETAFSQVERQQLFCLHPTEWVITPQMKSVIRQILESRAQEPLRRMFIEAKVMELLALALQRHDEHAMPSAGVQPLSKDAVDRMHEARHLVLARLDDPPSLPELARLVGTNEFTLKKDFKAVFGTTVYGLLFDHKMEHARALLLDTDRLVGDIAREVGYSHPASFSMAFMKAFGLSPSTLRKTV